jgi:beta-galactosidase
MRKLIFTVFSVILFISVLNNSIVVQAQERIDFTPKPFFIAEVRNPVISLNGIWNFSERVSDRFAKKPKISAFEWNNIHVPGEWVMQGFQVQPGTMAAYARSVTIPKDWENHQIKLKCDGVYSMTQVFLNGKSVGQHQGGFTPFELDLTKASRPGKENELIILVQNESTADTLASASQYAAHQLGGITRKLELFAVPNTFISKMHIESDLDESFKDALITAKFWLNNRSSKKPESVSARFMILSNEGDLIQEKTMDIDPDKLMADNGLEIQVPLSSPKLWDPEHPNLYDVFLILEKNNVILEKVHKRVGVREVNIAGNQVFVNGKPVKLRGVNRHEVHPTKGRSLSMEEWVTDATLFKEANVNYIRTSHYPPAEEFIAVCDSIGLFVELESPICWVGHGANDRWKTDNPHDPKFAGIIRQQVFETVEQYRNHPSVIIWSMANESAWGPIWEDVLQAVNQIDPSRPVSFHDQSYGGFNNFGSENTQIANIHYPGPGGPEIAHKYDRPLLFGEYAHLNTYNRQEIVTDPGVRDAWGRGLEKMWEDMYYSKGCLGGAIWSGIDDVFFMPDGTAVGYGEWGPIDGYRRPKPEYWHLKKIYSPIKITTNNIKIPGMGSPILVPVENRQLYTNMDEIEIRWSIGKSFGTARMSLEPRQSGILKIWPDREIVPKENLILSFVSPQGYEIDKYRIVFEGQVATDETQPGTFAEPQLQVLERIVTVINGSSEWVFNAPTGKIRSVTNKQQEVISDGPELFLIPLKTGPCNTEHSLLIEPLNYPCQNWNGKITSTGKNGNVVFVEVSGSYNEAEFNLRYSFDSSNLVTIDYSILAREDINPRQIGLIFTMPRKFDHLSWSRKGQWSIYPDNHIGRTEGSATPFPNGMREANVFGDKPDWTWEEDTHAMGSNDFRATRDRLYSAELVDQSGSGVRTLSDGTGAFRAFVDENNIRFLGASFSTAGGDLFFSSHLASERQPLKKGEVRKGRMVIEVL